MRSMGSWRSAGSGGPIAARVETVDAAPSYGFAARSAAGLAVLEGVARYLVVSAGLGQVGMTRLFDNYTVFPVFVVVAALMLALAAVVFARVSVGMALVIATVSAILGQVFVLAVFFVLNEARFMGVETPMFVSSAMGMFLSLLAMVLALKLALPNLNFGPGRVLLGAFISAARAIPLYFLISRGSAPDWLDRDQLTFLVSAGAWISYALIGYWMGLARLPRRS